MERLIEIAGMGTHLDSDGLCGDFRCLIETVASMTETNPENRPPPTTCASLRSATAGDTHKARGPAPVQSAPADPDYLTAQADKLEAFKQALYAAFVNAHKSGIPTALVDLAATYTSALRLQMTLKGFSAVPPRTAKAPMFNAGRK